MKNCQHKCQTTKPNKNNFDKLFNVKDREEATNWKLLEENQIFIYENKHNNPDGRHKS